MNLTTYESQGRATYARLSETIAALLMSSIRDDSSLRLQHIQHRAKDSLSLRRKLEKADALASDDIAVVAKDLAGCRLIFYTNSDVARFQSATILEEHFVVDWSRTKIHHPQPNASEAAQLFISNNYVIRLKDKCLAEAQFAEFRDLWCELQVQTTLNHAWSEMAHDTIYKTPALQGFGASLMEGIERRMKKIMRDYLLPAGYEFQLVAADFERLRSGKQLFDKGALVQLAACTDNNARIDLLERFEKYVLRSYDDLAAVQADIRSTIVSVAKEAFTTEIQVLETPFATLPGYSVETVFNVAADILDFIRYYDVKAALDALCTLFAVAPGKEVRKRLLKSAEDLAEQQLEIWKQAGPAVQMDLMERISRMIPSEIESARPIILKVLGEILGTELSGTSQTAYNTVALSRGVAIASPQLEATRATAMDLLFSLFRATPRLEDQREIVKTLARAMHYPNSGRPAAALEKMLLRDTARIVAFYVDMVPSLSFELLEHLEHTLLWQFRYKGKGSPQESDPEIPGLRAEVVREILAFRDLLNANQDFVIYKTLVGFEPVFAPEWESDLDHSASEAYRRERFRKLVEDVSEATADRWLAILVRCAETESDDQATFVSFGEFLELLAKEKPAVALRLLENLHEKLVRFLPALCTGLSVGGYRDELRQRLAGWITEGRYLGQILWYERHASTVDDDLLQQGLAAAIAAGNDNAVWAAVAAASVQHSTVTGGLIQRVLIPAVNYLAAKSSSSWVTAIQLRKGMPSILGDATPAQADLLLRSLVGRPEIDFRAEQILHELANSYPTKVIDFFGARIVFETIDKTYEPVPYELHFLPKSLNGSSSYLVNIAQQSFSVDRQHFRFEGGRLLANIFPTFTPEYEHCLTSLAQTRAKPNLEFLIELLLCYKGPPFIDALAKEIIEAMPTDDPLVDRVSIALDATGVLTGAFGRVEAYRKKKAQIEPWLEDSRERVRLFAKEHILGLDRAIAAEQRRSEEELELRKRGFDGPDSDPKT